MCIINYKLNSSSSIFLQLKTIIIIHTNLALEVTRNFRGNMFEQSQSHGKSIHGEFQSRILIVNTEEKITRFPLKFRQFM